MNSNQILRKTIKNQNIRVLSKYFFGIDLSPTQQEMVGDIAFQRQKRITISAMTRYGKTYCVAIGIALLILLNKNKKIAFIAPQSEQALIIRNYMTELIFECPQLFELADIEKAGKEQMKKEASRKRQTFSNGCEYRVFSAEGEANRLMGFGAPIIVKDEACLIKSEANAKITRMMGDSPQDNMLIELYNPWDRDNVAYEHSLDPNFKHYKIDWKTAVEEGRTTKEFVEEQRRELTPIEFKVLYESDFPDQPEDAVFSLSSINKADKLDLDLREDYIEKVISCDVADKGLDETVIFWGYKKENLYQIIDTYSEPKSENMNVAGRIYNIIKEFGGKDKTIVNIDCIGIGQGVISRLKELTENMDNVIIKPCHNGEKANDSQRFLNRKAENYFRLKSLIEEEQVKILDKGKLKQQLINIKWKFNSSGKVVIEDPEKSPDWADALMYFIWKGKNTEFAVGGISWT